MESSLVPYYTILPLYVYTTIILQLYYYYITTILPARSYSPCYHYNATILLKTALYYLYSFHNPIYSFYSLILTHTPAHRYLSLLEGRGPQSFHLACEANGGANRLTIAQAFFCSSSWRVVLVL